MTKSYCLSVESSKLIN